MNWRVDRPGHDPAWFATESAALAFEADWTAKVRAKRPPASQEPVHVVAWFDGGHVDPSEACRNGVRSAEQVEGASKVTRTPEIASVSESDDKRLIGERR